MGESTRGGRERGRSREQRRTQALAPRIYPTEAAGRMEERGESAVSSVRLVPVDVDEGRRRSAVTLIPVQSYSRHDNCEEDEEPEPELTEDIPAVRPRTGWPGAVQWLTAEDADGHPISLRGERVAVAGTSWELATHLIEAGLRELRATVSKDVDRDITILVVGDDMQDGPWNSDKGRAACELMESGGGRHLRMMRTGALCSLFRKLRVSFFDRPGGEPVPIRVDREEAERRPRVTLTARASARCSARREECDPARFLYACLACGSEVQSEQGRATFESLRRVARVCARCCEEKLEHRRQEWMLDTSWTSCAACQRSKGSFLFPGWTAWRDRRIPAICRHCLDPEDRRWERPRDWTEDEAVRAADILIHEMLVPLGANQGMYTRLGKGAGPSTICHPALTGRNQPLAHGELEALAFTLVGQRLCKEDAVAEDMEMARDAIDLVAARGGTRETRVVGCSQAGGDAKTISRKASSLAKEWLMDTHGLTMWPLNQVDVFLSGKDWAEEWIREVRREQANTELYERVHQWREDEEGRCVHAIYGGTRLMWWAAMCKHFLWGQAFSLEESVTMCQMVARERVMCTARACEVHLAHAINRIVQVAHTNYDGGEVGVSG